MDTAATTPSLDPTLPLDLKSALPRALTTAELHRAGADLFLLDVTSGEVFEINATAAAIFGLCQRGATYETAVQELAAAVQATGQDALILQDVRDTVKQFQELGLCEP